MTADRPPRSTLLQAADREAVDALHVLQRQIDNMRRELVTASGVARSTLRARIEAAESKRREMVDGLRNG